MRPPAFEAASRWHGRRGRLLVNAIGLPADFAAPGEGEPHAGLIRASGERLEEATLDLDRLRSPFWRLTVTDAGGKRAWTNPVWETAPP
jgi:hypothetical protein